MNHQISHINISLFLCSSIVANRHDHEGLDESEGKRGAKNHVKTSQKHSRARLMRRSDDTLHVADHDPISIVRIHAQACDKSHRPWQTFANPSLLLARRVQESAIRADVYDTSDRADLIRSLLYRNRQLSRTTDLTHMRPDGESASATIETGK